MIREYYQKFLNFGKILGEYIITEIHIAKLRKIQGRGGFFSSEYTSRRAVSFVFPDTPIGRHTSNEDLGKLIEEIRANRRRFE